MTSRVAGVFSITMLLIASACFVTAQQPAASQDSSRPATPAQDSKAKSTPQQPKQPQADNKTGNQPAKPGQPEKPKGPPPPPSPKLIEVPQTEENYTPRPKIVAIFIFKNGDRIETDNYLVTKDAVFITNGGQKTRYPIGSVDRAATQAANTQRGIVITFPKSNSEFNLD